MHLFGFNFSLCYEKQGEGAVKCTFLDADFIEQSNFQRVEQ